MLLREPRARSHFDPDIVGQMWLLARGLSWQEVLRGAWLGVLRGAWQEVLNGDCAGKAAESYTGIAATVMPITMSTPAEIASMKKSVLRRANAAAAYPATRARTS